MARRLGLGLIVASLLFGARWGLVLSRDVCPRRRGHLYFNSKVMHLYRADRYVSASLSFFAAVASLFYQVLTILISLGR